MDFSFFKLAFGWVTTDERVHDTDGRLNQKIR